MVCSVVELRMIVGELSEVARAYGVSNHPHAESTRARLAGPSRQRAEDLHGALSYTFGVVTSPELLKSHQTLLRITNAIAHARASEWEPALTRAHDIARALIREIAPDLVGAFALREDVLEGADGGQIMGAALSQSFRRLLRNQITQTLAWSDAVAEEFIRQAHVDGLEFIEAPDALASNLETVHKKLLTAIGEDTTSWAARGNVALHESVWPIATRHEAPSGSKGAALRLAALSLATEAVSSDDAKLRYACRAIAAGITVLERRANGEVPITETIMLAPAH